MKVTSDHEFFWTNKNQLKYAEHILRSSASSASTDQCFFSPAAIQAKLQVNQPGDVYEQEADSMADKVMRMPGSASTFFKPAAEQVQRKCSRCEEENKLQKKEAGGTGNHAFVTSLVQETLSSAGQPLEPGTRSFMESRFGYDFRNVQVHDDSAGHQSAQQINAQAYTHKNHIAFAPGKYQTGTDAGKRLLAHELAHVIQQNGQATGIQKKEETADDTDHTQGWDNDMESFSKVAAEHYLRMERKDFFDSVKSIECQEESGIRRECTVTTRMGKTVNVLWQTDTKRVIVQAAKHGMQFKCGYDYIAMPGQTVVFKKIKCWNG